MKNKIISSILLIFMIMSAFSVCAEEDIKRFYVSPFGDDSQSGEIESPLKTLEGARKKVRESGLLKKKKIEVIFLEGNYNFSDTVTFEAKDSGSKDFPVTYKAEEGKNVYFSGGVAVKYGETTTVSDTETIKRFNPDVVDKIRQINLSDYGVTSVPEQPRNDPYITPPAAPTRFYYNDEELTLSRWPNGDEWVYTGKIISPDVNHTYGRTSKEAKGATFIYKDERIEKWATYDDVWIYGRFTYDWCPNSTLISVNKEENTITTTYNSPGGYYIDKPYYYFNVLEELDSPGEYYADRKTKKLYFYPPSDDKNAEMFLTLMDKPFIDFSYSHYINFENITFQGTRSNGLTSSYARGIKIYNCTLRYMGMRAIEFLEGYEYIVDNCVIYECGSGGIRVKSGDIKYLKPSGTRIINNHIYNFSRWKQTYSAAVAAGGAYEVIANNEIHGGNHLALTPYTGTVIEYNDIYDVLQTADDAGILYAYCTATQTDIHVRNNFFHSSGERGRIVNTGNWAVYWDGWTSGNHVYNNVFYDLEGGVHHNGGQFHNVYNNLFINCETDLYMHICLATPTTPDFWKWVDTYECDKGIWRERYPRLAQYRNLSSSLMWKGNTTLNNITYGASRTITDPSSTPSLPNVYKNNVKVGKDVFKDFDNYDFSMGEKNPLPDDFKEIDMTKIGVNKRTYDEIEANLPEYSKYY